MIKNLWLILLLVLTLSCGQQGNDTSEDEITDFDQISFFDVVYETLAVRQTGQSDWVLTDGNRDLKFETDTAIDENENLPDTVEGTFQFALEAYTRTQAITPCSGGWDGEFSLDLFEEGGDVGTIEDAGDTPYSVLEPYDPDDGTSTAIDPADVVEGIRTYYFSLKVDNISLYPQESCSFPFIEHSLKVIRFPNGTLIMVDNSKGLEYFLRPKLRTVREE